MIGSVMPFFCSSWGRNAILIADSGKDFQPRMNTDEHGWKKGIDANFANREESKTIRVNSRNSRQGFVGHPCSSVFIRGLIFFPLVWLRFRLRPPDETQRGFASCLL